VTRHASFLSSSRPPRGRGEHDRGRVAHALADREPRAVADERRGHPAGPDSHSASGRRPSRSCRARARHTARRRLSRPQPSSSSAVVSVWVCRASSVLRVSSPPD
jgi:hypothetical protein